MSGLKNVLGNVYGDPDDRPNKANLDDVKESMDALTEHADDGEPALPGGSEESPWAMLDELPDLNQSPAPADESAATKPDREEIATEEPATEDSWLPDVQVDGLSEDWLNDYDDSGWTGSKQDETPATNADDANDVDELANFDFASIEHPTDEASVEDLRHRSVGETSSAAAESFTEVSDSGNSDELSASDTDDLDPDQEAWLDDLFSLDDDSEDETAEDQSSSKVDDVESAIHDTRPAQSTDTVAPVMDETASLASTGLDAISAIYSASDQKSRPHSDTTSTIDPPAGGFYRGWARTDDDILPQKKSGRRGAKKTEVSVIPDPQQTAQSQNHSISDDMQSLSVEAPLASGDHPQLVEANFENAAVEEFTDLFTDDLFTDAPREAAPQLDEPDAEGLEMPGFDQPLLQSDEELDESDAVHLFAHDEALEEAATAGGRRKARKEAAKQAKTDEAAQAKVNKEAAKEAKTDKAALAKAKKEAKNASRGRKGRGKKNKNDNNDDEALRAQVDAALAAQVATNTGLSADDFWTDSAAVPAAEVTPSAPAGMADPLDTELVSPPPAPVEGFDPDPVLD
ncbi:MAG: hypothetical protein GXP35_02675 [Actinobacteria bacterium]|nr:hypothetical protein [Actinomycetota bacterium]